jgi:hypothetical protein
MTQKKVLIRELDQILMVHNVSWHLLPREDLERLVMAFRKLKFEVEQVFALVDEITDEAPLAPSEDKREWKRYTT